VMRPGKKGQAAPTKIKKERNEQQIVEGRMNEGEQRQDCKKFIPTSVATEKLDREIPGKSTVGQGKRVIEWGTRAGFSRGNTLEPKKKPLG